MRLEARLSYALIGLVQATGYAGSQLPLQGVNSDFPVADGKRNGAHGAFAVINDLRGDGVLHVLLDETLKIASAVGGAVALFGEIRDNALVP